MSATVALCLIAGRAVPATAEDMFQRPESCVLVATAQFDDCDVENHFRCPGESAPIRIESNDGDGDVTIEIRDAEHGTVSIDFASNGMAMRMTDSGLRPQEVIRDGSGTSTIIGTMTIFGMTRPMSGSQITTNTGELIDMADETFARLAYTASMTLPPPVPAITGSGSILYNDRLDLLIEEVTRIDDLLEPDETRLMQVILSGQQGFGETTPRYGCGELSSLPIPRTETPA